MRSGKCQIKRSRKVQVGGHGKKKTRRRKGMFGFIEGVSLFSHRRSLEE